MKKLALILSMAFMMTAFVGCGADTNNSTDTPQEQQEIEYKTTYLNGFEFEILSTLVGSGMIGYYENQDFYFDIEIFEDESKESVVESIERDFISYQEVEYASIFDYYEFAVESETGFGEIETINGDNYEYNVVTAYYTDGTMYALGYLLVDQYTLYFGSQSFEVENQEIAHEILMHTMKTVKYAEEGDMTVTAQNFEYEIPNYFEYLGAEGQYANENMYISLESISAQSETMITDIALPAFIEYHQTTYADTYVGHSYHIDSEDGYGEITLNNGKTYKYNVLDIEFVDGVLYSQAYMHIDNYAVYIGIQTVSEEYKEEADATLMSILMSTVKVD